MIKCTNERRVKKDESAYLVSTLKRKFLSVGGTIMWIYVFLLLPILAVKGK